MDYKNAFLLLSAEVYKQGSTAVLSIKCEVR